jgi:hypothetical protein
MMFLNLEWPAMLALAAALSAGVGSVWVGGI